MDVKNKLKKKRLLFSEKWLLTMGQILKCRKMILVQNYHNDPSYEHRRTKL